MALQTRIQKGEEIRHFSHPQHPLNLISLSYLYTCSGCKEYGAGPRYRCSLCNIDVHEFCAKAPASIAHPYHTQHRLIFYAKPGGFIKSSKCDVCGKTTKGFAFRCTACHFALHPCCAQLPQELNHTGHSQHSLKLLGGSPCPQGSPYTCNLCGKKGSSWVYHCAPCDFYLHALCAKTLINGLEAQGITPPEKPSKMTVAARFASHVVQGFFDGLVEGLGEGVADVLLDNVTREVKAEGTTDDSDNDR